MNFIADFHTHSLASTHAYSTLDEMLRAASGAGLYAMALTDHAPGVPDAPHEWHFLGLRNLPDTIHGVRFFSGCEANVLDPSGSLDLSDKLLSRLGFVIASMHSLSYERRSCEENTLAWLACCDNPLVDCLGHTGQPQYPFDIEAVVLACKKTGTLIEINNGSFGIRGDSIPNCKKIAEACKQHSVQIIVNSDAHSAYNVGIFSRAAELLGEVGFPEELVVNSSVPRLEAYLSGRNKPRR